MENAKQFFEEKTKEDNDNDDDSLTSVCFFSFTPELPPTKIF